jgi:hypothetical protein
MLPMIKIEDIFNIKRLMVKNEDDNNLLPLENTHNLKVMEFDFF